MKKLLAIILALVMTVGAVFTMDEIERTANALKDAREKMEYWHDKALEYEKNCQPSLALSEIKKVFPEA